MGSWFSNIHIRKNETATEETIEKCIGKIMASKHYLPCTSEIDADGAIAVVVSEDCCWISIYSDLLSLEVPSKCAEIMAPLSSELHTDVLGISCFDSDYLYPTHKTIAADTKCSVSTVKRAISELVKAGYIEKINRRRPNGAKTSNIYICK